MKTEPAGRSAPVRLRPAREADLASLESLIASEGADGSLLPRSRAELHRALAQFWLAVSGGRIVGCGALQPVDAHLAEIRSVAVDPAWRGLGIGGRLVRTLLRQAKRRGLRRVFCLTRRQEFFGRIGFRAVPMERYPHKIRRDCLPCPRRLGCDETAMERLLERRWAPRGVLL